jgi:hypothetical protein
MVAAGATREAMPRAPITLTPPESTTWPGSLPSTLPPVSAARSRALP